MQALQEVTTVLPAPQQELEVELEQQAEAILREQSIAPTCESCLFYCQSTLVGICAWHVCFVLPQDKACGHHQVDVIGI